MYCGMQGHKANACTAKKQRMNESSGNEGKNQKNKCFLCGKPGHFSKNCPEKHNNMARQTGLFVGHVGEDCVYMMQELRAHKNNRDWNLDISSSNNTMSDDEDRKPSAVNSLDNHNNNNNNNNNNNSSNNNNGGLDLDDFVETEDYEPTDPDGFDQQISDIFGSKNHDDLLRTTATAVNSIMACWGTHMYHWYCHNCNQQLLNTGHGDVWKCPTCIYLDISKGDNVTHWDFGVCERSENIGPADMTCVTCLINEGMGTYQALKKALTIYKEEPTLFAKKELAIWASYFYYLEEQCLEVDTWNRLKWLEYYENPPKP
jgi:Zinc knuckle